MSHLSKEYFDKALKDAVHPLATKADLKDQTEELARITKAGFDSVDKQLAAITKMLDVRKDVEQLKLQIKDIRQALKLD